MDLPSDGAMTGQAVRQALATGLKPDTFSGRRVLAIIPDAPRTAPVALFCRLLEDRK